MYELEARLTAEQASLSLSLVDDANAAHILVVHLNLVLVGRVLVALGPVGRRLLAATIWRLDFTELPASQNLLFAPNCALALENTRATNSVSDDRLH